MSHARVVILTILALAAFAGNSLLCRAALSRTHIDAASFTSVRLLSGALMLWILASLRGGARALSALLLRGASVDPMGSWYAFLSGALTSGVGYAIWYTALPFLKSTTAAAVQLGVPVIAALGGVALLGEPLTLRLLAASIAIVGGIALVVLAGKR